MKYLILSLMLVSGFAMSAQQSTASFFDNGAYKVISYMAHPTNTYRSGSYAWDQGDLIVQVRSKCNWTGNSIVTKIKLYVKEGLFTGLGVMYDNDTTRPFSAISMLKDLVDEEYVDHYSTSDSQVVQFVENNARKTYSSFNGKDLTVLVLDLLLLSE